MQNELEILGHSQNLHPIPSNVSLFTIYKMEVEGLAEEEVRIYTYEYINSH